jgi:hypothetical protein
MTLPNRIVETMFNIRVEERSGQPVLIAPNPFGRPLRDLFHSDITHPAQHLWDVIGEWLVDAATEFLGSSRSGIALSISLVTLVISILVSHLRHVTDVYIPKPVRMSAATTSSMTAHLAK